MPKQVPFHGAFSSADASALDEGNSRITLYGAGTTTQLATLGSSDRVHIHDIHIVVGSALTVYVYDGADATPDAGEFINRGVYAANESDQEHLHSPHICQAGTYPKVKTSGAGQIDVIIRGWVERAQA